MLTGQQAHPNQGLRCSRRRWPRGSGKRTRGRQGNAREKAVVDDPLQHVEVLGIAVQEEHALVPQGVGDGRTGFVVGGRIGQFVVLAESLAGMPGADAAGKVKLLGHHVFPNAVDGLRVGLVASQCGHVGNTGIEIAGTDGMANGLVLLRDRLVVLVVGAVELWVSARPRMSMRNFARWRYFTSPVTR